MSMSNVFLFQGDSITDCHRPREQEGMGASYAFLIAAKLSEQLADKQPQFYNRGISGNRVSDIAARWNEDTYYLQPNLLSILIGVNDAWRIVNKLPHGTKDRFARTYRQLLEETVEELPNCAIVLMEPFILKTKEMADDWAQWTELLSVYRAEVKALAEQFNIVFVPLQDAFDEACKTAPADFWLYDGVHPTPAGHQLIANKWLDVVSNSKYSSLIK